MVNVLSGLINLLAKVDDLDLAKLKIVIPPYRLGLEKIKG